MNPNREKGKNQWIDGEGKLTYEQSADGNKPKYIIKGSDKELFIGTYAGSSSLDSSLRPSNPCVIRRYDSNDRRQKLYDRLGSAANQRKSSRELHPIL